MRHTMQLTVKLVGPLSRYLPSESEGGVTQVEAEAGLTVSGLVKKLGLPEDIKCMISINDDLVPIGERQSRTLSDLDSVKIIPPLKGG